MSSTVLTDKDINATTSTAQQPEDAKADIKSMEYHRQVLQSKMDEQAKQAYVSPSDSILSPCTAKLSAYRSKKVSQVKGRSLFAQAATKNFYPAVDGEEKADGL